MRGREKKVPAQSNKNLVRDYPHLSPHPFTPLSPLSISISILLSHSFKSHHTPPLSSLPIPLPPLLLLLPSLRFARFRYSPWFGSLGRLVRVHNPVPDHVLCPSLPQSQPYHRKLDHIQLQHCYTKFSIVLVYRIQELRGTKVESSNDVHIAVKSRVIKFITGRKQRKGTPAYIAASKHDGYIMRVRVDTAFFARDQNSLDGVVSTMLSSPICDRYTEASYNTQGPPLYDAVFRVHDAAGFSFRYDAVRGLRLFSTAVPSWSGLSIYANSLSSRRSFFPSGPQVDGSAELEQSSWRRKRSSTTALSGVRSIHRRRSAARSTDSCASDRSTATEGREGGRRFGSS